MNEQINKRTATWQDENKRSGRNKVVLDKGVRLLRSHSGRRSTFVYSLWFGGSIRSGSVVRSALVRWPNSLFYLLALSLVLFACGSDNRQTAHIPDFPKTSDSSRTAGALRALTQAINQSSPASAYARRAVILLAMGRVSDALADIDEAISRNDNAGSYYLTKAQILRALQQPAKALENAQRAELLGVETPELYTLQGDLLQQQRQFDKARLYVAKALQMAPYDGEAYFFNGLMAAKQGDTAQALALYQQSLRLKPRYLETYNQLASVYRELGDLSSALAYNGQALRYFPRNARLYYGRGLIYHIGGEPDSALACYQQTVTLQPTYHQAYFQTGLLHQKARNYAAALADYRRVEQLRPQFPRIDTYLGYCYEQLGQYDLAIAAYTKATNQNAADRQAAAGLWRTQRHQYAQNSYNSLFLPNASAEPLTQTRSRSVPDTTRVRLSVIQPKSHVSTGHSDSLRRVIRPLGPN